MAVVIVGIRLRMVGMPLLIRKPPFPSRAAANAYPSTYFYILSCHNYINLILIFDPDSFSQIDYSIRCMFPKWSDWNIQYTTKGLLKHRISQILKVIALAASILGAWYIRHDVRGGLMGLLMLVRGYVKVGVLRLLLQVQSVAQRL